MNMPTMRHGLISLSVSTLAVKWPIRPRFNGEALAGPFLSLVIELKFQFFVELAPRERLAIHKREREELVTRFFAYSDGLEGYKDKPALFCSITPKAQTEKSKMGR